MYLNMNVENIFKWVSFVNLMAQSWPDPKFFANFIIVLNYPCEKGHLWWSKYQRIEFSIYV